MCGIVGFTGNNEAAPILLDGLSKLEYRGYDSAGIAVRNGDAEPEIVKAKGKLKVLKEMTNDGKAVKGACGIGLSLWATDGEPSSVNAHPDCSDDDNVIAVHNGIIEIYQELREKLIKKGYRADEKKSPVIQPVSTNILKCPKCGSTSITTEEIGYGTFGWIGASQKKNLCQKCGYKWWPGTK